MKPMGKSPITEVREWLESSGAPAAGPIADRPGPQLRPARPIQTPGIARRTAQRIAREVADELNVEPLELRAQAWHFEMIGRGCECFEAECYPCDECKRESAEVLELLRSVTDAAITATVRVIQRGAEIPRGRRQP